jgi:hypothetical protein
MLKSKVWNILLIEFWRQNPFEFQETQTHVPICQKLNLRFSIIVIYIWISFMLIKTQLVFEVKVKALTG